MIGRLVVTRVCLTTKNRCLSGTPWRIPGSQDKPTQWTFKGRSIRELGSTWDQRATMKYHPHSTYQTVSTVTPVDNSKETCNSSDRATRPPSLAEASPKDSTPTPDQSLSFTLRCSEKQVDLELAGAVITSERTCSQPKNHLKRIGGITRLPTKFID